MPGSVGSTIARMWHLKRGHIRERWEDFRLPHSFAGVEAYPAKAGMEARPDLKVIVCTGYSIDGPAQEILDAGAEGFIQKPFLIAALADKLKEVLEGK